MNRPSFPRAALLALCVIPLTACGDDSTSATESDSGTTEAATTEGPGTSATTPTTTATTADTTSSTGVSSDGSTGETTGSSSTDATDSNATSDGTTMGISDTDGTETDGGTETDTDTDTDTDTGGPWDGLFPVEVGDVGPIDPDNPLQYPFACRTEDIGLGQPEVDNLDQIGLPVLDENDEVIGWSRDCGAKTRVDYFYLSTDPPPEGGLTPLPDPQNLPDDIATVEIDGQPHNYIVRYERGTINRFVYGIAVLEPTPADDPNAPDLSAWNDKLIFWFGGGVGIGHQQSSGLGVNRLKDSVANNPYKDGPLYQPLLEQGYAIVYSTGTVTDTTYNLRLTGTTAVMVKEHFRLRYNEPKYTFGLGGSGGAIQQFIYEQNHPDLLDGLVPTHAYADMITQTTRVGDCELLEFYFDVLDGGNATWKSWDNRRKIEGFNALNGAPSDWDFLNQGVPLGSTADPGTSECIEGWRGLSPLSLNPHWVDIDDSQQQILDHDPEGFAQTAWTFHDDLIDIFGADPESQAGYARTTWDNVGVQYGLQALLDGDITTQEFIALNAGIGGWKRPDDMVQEGFPFYGDDQNDFDIWSARNSTSTLGLPVAPRATGNVDAMHSAYYEGLVYLGEIEDPIINLMPYLEPYLDMHNSKQPFVIRQRMEDAQGAAPNHVIWALGPSEAELMTLASKAFMTLETWLDDQQKPADAIDACYTDGLALVASGDDVWDGVQTAEALDNGPCADTYEVFRGPRMVAGEDFSADIFKCTTKKLEAALEDGTYGGIEFTPEELTQLVAIFGESGVCDYTLPDAGRPDDL